MNSNVISFTYKTKSLQEAAALWAQQNFKVEYTRLDAIEHQTNKFKFVFEVHTSQEAFNKYKNDYVNRRVQIEPKTYDAMLNSLRDNLAIAKV